MANDFFSDGDGGGGVGAPREKAVGDEAAMGEEGRDGADEDGEEDEEARRRHREHREWSGANCENGSELI